MAVNQLKAGVFLSYILLVLNTLIGLLYTPFLIRMLGPSDYGLYSLAISVIGYLTVLDLGFGNAIVRYTSKFRAEGKLREQEEMFGMFFIIYWCISALAFIIAIILIWNTENLFSSNMTAEEIKRMRIILLLMSFNLAFTFPMSIWGSIITAYEKFVFQKTLNIIRTLLNPLVMIVLLLNGYKAISLVVVTTAFNVLTLVINYFYCKKQLHIKLRFSKFKWGFLKEVTTYSFWIALNVIMDSIYWGSGQFILGMYCGTTAVAVYAVAIQLKNMYFMFSTAMSSVFLPKVTYMVSKGTSEEDLSNLFIRTGRLQFLVMAFILTSFIVFGRDFVKLWAGNSYEEAYTIALLFFIPTLVPLIQNLGITILQAKNQMKFRCISYVIIAISSLFLSVPLSKTYGGMGCAVATASALVIGQIIIMNIYYHKVIHLNIIKFWKQIAQMSIVPILVGIVGYFVFSKIEISSISQFVAYAAIFSLFYILTIWKKGMNMGEKELFSRPCVMLISKILKK